MAVQVSKSVDTQQNNVRIISWAPGGPNDTGEGVFIGDLIFIGVQVVGSGAPATQAVTFQGSPDNTNWGDFSTGGAMTMTTPASATNASPVRGLQDYPLYIRPTFAGTNTQTVTCYVVGRTQA